MLGRNHPLTRRLRALRRDGGLRREEQVLIAEGVHLTEEALAAGAAVDSIVVAQGLDRMTEGRGLVTAARERGIPIHEVAPRLMEALQDARSPQPVLSIVRWSRPSVAAVLRDAGREPLIVVAHRVQDPGNLGSLLRTADAAGATALLVVEPAADLSHPRTVRATMGSIFRLPAAAGTLEEIREALLRAGVRTVGSSPSASASYFEENWRGALALFLGGEGAGLPPALLAGLDATVGIPMRAGVESLSVGAAAAVLLFEAKRRRG